MKLKTRCSKKNVQLDGSSTFMVIVLPKGSLYDMFTYSWLMFMDVYGTLVVRLIYHTWILWVDVCFLDKRESSSGCLW